MSFNHAAAVERYHPTIESKPGIVVVRIELGKRCNRHLTPAFEPAQKGAFGRNGDGGSWIMYCLANACSQ